MVAPDSELKAFSSHLKFLEESGDLPTCLDLRSFDFDIAQGLFFDSTVPQGFGVGSSGALTAAVYDRYAEKREENENILELKKIFSAMESHFHRSSSGVDPLVSFLRKSIFIKGKEDFSVVEIPNLKEREGAIFLLNTGRPRKTGPLVDLFLEKHRQRDFDRRYNRELLPITNLCITHFFNSDRDGLIESFKELSRFQYECFTPMIPPLFKDVWERGLNGHDYHLKLCGAGGGGFLLGLTKDYRKIDTHVLRDCEIRPIVWI